MSETELRIVKAGPLTSIQAAGRVGWMRYGVSRAGPVDRRSFAAALIAAGCERDAVAIELSHGGLTLAVHGAPIGFALAGAAEAWVDGRKLGADLAATLSPGGSLEMRVRGGNWAYLALAGELEADRWLGSAATDGPTGMGGGRIAAGRVLRVSNARQIETRSFPFPTEPIRISHARAILGPQHRFFSPETVAMLAHFPFRVTAGLNRMGLVLDHAPLPPLRLDMPSEPVARGGLQVNGEGRATLLLADHQSTGGYPRIATLLGCDADRVAQLPAGAEFTLELLDPPDAIAHARRTSDREAAWLAEIAAMPDLAARLLAHNLITILAED